MYVIIVGQTIQISVIASVWILVVALVFIPNPVSSAFVFLSVESTIIGITRFMIFWDVNLDPFSIIYLIISFGFSVNCSFHIAYGFNVLHNETSLNRLGLSFGVFGYPIVQSAISSVLGTSVLLFSPGYLYQSFGKVIILAMTFGLLHGLVFFPPLLLLLNKISKDGNSNPEDYPPIPGANSNFLCRFLYEDKSTECEHDSRSEADSPSVIFTANNFRPSNDSSQHDDDRELGSDSAELSFSEELVPGIKFYDGISSIFFREDSGPHIECFQPIIDDNDIATSYV